MGKVKERIRKYNSEWESKPWAKGWLIKADPDSFHEAFCKLCRVSLRAHVTDLERHSLTKKHLEQMSKLNIKEKITQHHPIVFGEADKKRDLMISAYIACHSAVRSVDDLCSIIRDLGKGSSLENFNLHRTKCANIIKHVIAPSMLSELIDDIGNSKVSLIVGESTDVSCLKFLCLCVKYFSINKNKIITDYLGIISVESSTAEVLYDSVKNFLNEINLSDKNIVGLGCYGGTSLCAKYNSLYAYLKKTNPSLQLNRCVCHSLDNCASRAAEEFPASIDFLLREIYNWFSHSAKRRAEYKSLWDTLNASTNPSQEGANKPFRQFVSLSNTRWLARFDCVSVILDNWFELKTLFSAVVKKEKCYSARLLNEMLDDNSNYLYLKLVKPILSEIQRVNLLFQRDDVDLCRLFDDLSDLMLLFGKMILKKSFYDCGIYEVLNAFGNNLAYRSINEIDFGIEFNQAAESCYVEGNKKTEICDRGFKYIKRLCCELSLRIPTGLKQFRGLYQLLPSICINKDKPKFKDQPFLCEFANSEKLGEMELQWNKLSIVDWKNVFNGTIPTQSIVFWPKVFMFQDAYLS